MIATQLERLIRAHGVSGNEAEVRALLEEEARPSADEITTDAMGTLIVHKAGPGPKILLAAHMDTVGIMATHWEKEGVLRFAPIGGLEPTAILHAPVRFSGGQAGLISCDEKKLGKELKISDLFVDIGSIGPEKLPIFPGDTAAFCTPCLRSGERVIAPYLDNRAGCAVLLTVLSTLKHTRNDLYFAFTVQEEVGTRGAGPVAHLIQPDFALVIDVTCADDIPGALHEGTTAVGKGAAVKVMDHSFFCDPGIVRRLNALARTGDIPVQQDVLTGGGSDGGPISRSRIGVPTGGISIPCRYTHAPTELIDLNDFDACIRLTRAFCESEL